jgi:hypothetical protein
MGKEAAMPEWLELELSHQLSPAVAPDELWERIENGRLAPRRQMTRWPIAAIVTLAVAAATLWLAAKGAQSPLSLEQLALEQLRHPAALDLRSENRTEIAEWTRRNTGVELSIPSATPARLAGARVIRRNGVRIAAVEYTVGHDTATLLIAPASERADSPHGRYSWKSAGLSYALACSNPEHAEEACLLCHASL